jgi:hypothetical protein
MMVAQLARWRGRAPAKRGSIFCGGEGASREFLTDGRVEGEENSALRRGLLVGAGEGSSMGLVKVVGLC